MRDPLDKIPIGIHSYGLTHITKRETAEDEVIVIVEHYGNMGNTIEDVDNNLFKFCGVRFFDLDFRQGYLRGTEQGYPDYSYKRVWFFSKKWTRDHRMEKERKAVRSSYFETPIYLGDTPRQVRQAWGRPWHMQKEGCCLYYYWGALSRPHSVVKFIDGKCESIWSDATRGLITRGKDDR